MTEGFNLARMECKRGNHVQILTKGGRFNLARMECKQIIT